MDSNEFREYEARGTNLQQSALEIMHRVFQAEGDPERLDDLHGLLDDVLSLASRTRSYVAESRVHQMSTYIEYVNALEQMWANER